MRCMSEEVKERLKRLHVEFADTQCEAHKAATKINIEELFPTQDVKGDRRKLGLIRDVSDNYIRMGSLLRRICDLAEPFLEEDGHV